MNGSHSHRVQYSQIKIIFMRFIFIIAIGAAFLMIAPPSVKAQGAGKEKASRVIEGNLRRFDFADDRILVALVPCPKNGDETQTFRVTDATVYRLDDKETAKDDALRPGLRVKVTFAPSNPEVALKVRAYTSTLGEPRSVRRPTL